MAYDPNLTDAQAKAREYMTPDELAWISDPSHFRMRSGDSRAAHDRAYANIQARKALEAKAMARWGEAVRAEKAAEKAKRDAEAKAEAERAEEVRRAALTPWQREIEDHAREAEARWEAKRAAEAANPNPTDPPKPRHETMTVPQYSPPPAPDRADADALDAHARALADKALAEPTEGNRCQAAIAAADAAAARALVRFEAEKRAADLTLAERERAAGADPVARARARADAAGMHATRLGEAEAAKEAAELARDRTIVEVASKAALAAWRIESRKAQMKADAAQAENDPHALGNPYWRPPVSLAKFQFDALPPEAQRRAIEDGVKIYDDAPPAFSAVEAANVLRSRGSANRSVMTRSEYNQLSPADQRAAARSAIIID